MKHTIGVLLLAGLTITGCATRKSAEVSSGSGGTGDSSIDGSLIAGDNLNLPQDGDRSIFAPVYFDYDSSQVKPDEAGTIEAVAKSLKKGKYRGVIVEGHADERGSREYNLALGETRSLAVRDYLVSLGVELTVMQTKSYGEEQPAVDGHDEQAWSQNRRVEFAVY